MPKRQDRGTPKTTPAQSKLAREMAATAATPPVQATCHFTNDDVPRFLRELDRFEASSRRVRIVTR